MSTHDLFSEHFGELIGRGAQSAVYAREDVAVKVYNLGYGKENVFYEAAMMCFVEATGLAMPRPIEVLSVAGQMCLKMSRVTGQSFGAVMAGNLGRARELMDDLVRLQLDIHGKQIPLPISLKQRLRERLRYNANLNTSRRQALLTLCDSMPDGDVLCHGDFHGANILVDNGAYAVIDWIEAAKGDPRVDASHSYVAMGISSRDYADLYLERYCAASGAKREDILRWLPVQAGSLYGFIPDSPALLQMMDGRW